MFILPTAAVSKQLLYGSLGVALMLSAVSAKATDLTDVRKLLKSGDYPQAVSQARLYVAEKPDDIQGRFLLGLALARANQVDAAIKVFGELATENPKLAEPNNNLGVLYARQGKLQQARESLEKAVKAAPEHTSAQENLGDVYVALARDAYEASVKSGKPRKDVREKQQYLQALLDSDASAVVVSRTPESAVSAADTARPTSAADDVPAEQAVKLAARGWAQAWSAQNLQAYLGAYSPDFVPAGGQSRSAWKNEREQRVSAPRSINVSLSNMAVSAAENNRYVVSFDQRYRSDGYQDKERKALLMAREGGLWRILREDSPTQVLAAAGTIKADAPVFLDSSDDAGNADSAAAPAAALAGSAASGSTGEPMTVVRNWAQAWSNQNLEGYFAAYSERFDPEGGQTLKQWIRERQNRISAPSFIEVEITDLSIDRINAETVLASFTQKYRADNYSDRENKALILQQEANGWRIVRETTQ